MTHTDTVLTYLQKITPREATNSDIVSKTGIRPHQTIFMITRVLMREGKIKGMQSGHEWRFWSPVATNSDQSGSRQPEMGYSPPEDTPADRMASIQFEIQARRAMSNFYGTLLQPGPVPGVPKQFDLVSADRSIVGDAKFYRTVNGTSLPPAKFSIIAEYVWLLEKTNAPHRFLVFGNDRRVPVEWLKRYGSLAPSVAFYFIGSNNLPERLGV